jgi:transglutaminase/protease-like cytokinesis protein 3
VYDQNGNKFAEFLIENEKGIIPIEIIARLEILTHDLNTVKKGKIASIDLPNKYLGSEKYIEKDDSLIRSMGRAMLGKNRLNTVKNIYSFVNQNMKYDGYNPNRKGAAKALNQLKGDCTEFADLFVALCRSCNIPAMVIDGYTLNYSVTPKHSWAEVYFDQYGWVRFDPTTGNSNVFNKLVNQYIQLYTGRNNENIGDFNFYRYTYWGDPILILEDLKLYKKD